MPVSRLNQHLTLRNRSSNKRCNRRVITALSHPNIALIKYWGKQPGSANIPATASLSITLDGLSTRTSVSFDASAEHDQFLLNGELTQDRRVFACIDRFRALARERQSTCPDARVLISSDNDFPTAAGLASSASGFSALTTALNALYATELDSSALSVQSRQGSASAARSHFGGFVLLDGENTHSDSWRAAPLADREDWPLNVVVAICSQSAKTTSSSSGMNHTRDTSPYYERWISSSRSDIRQAMAAVNDRNFKMLAEVSEYSCLKMHAVMLSARPGLIYWNPATLACIETLKTMQKRGCEVFFTIDAGPQVKAICLGDALEDVKQALAETHGVKELLVTGLGEGARLEADSP